MKFPQFVLSTAYSKRSDARGGITLSLLSLIALAGCAVQPQQGAIPVAEVRISPTATGVSTHASGKRALFITWLDQQNRLYRVAAPLLSRNTELCPRHARHLLGMTAKTKFSFPEEFVAEAEEVLGLDARLRVTNVFAGGSAALAGVQEGDVLLAAGIEPMPEGPGAEQAAASLIAAELQAHPLWICCCCAANNGCLSKCR